MVVLSLNMAGLSLNTTRRFPSINPSNHDSIVSQNKIALKPAQWIKNFEKNNQKCLVKWVFSIDAVAILLDAGSGPNYYREDAPHFK